MNEVQLLECALEAVRHARNSLPTGASNWPVDKQQPGAKQCVQVMRLDHHLIVRDDGALNSVSEILEIAEDAERAGCGNCQEFACVAFKFLWDRGVRPIHYLYRPKGDHNLIAIGPENREKWIVVDAWAGLAEPWPRFQDASLTDRAYRYD